MNFDEKYEIIKNLKTKTTGKRTLLLKSKADGNFYVGKLFSTSNVASKIAWLREKTVDFEAENICNYVESGNLSDYHFVVREFVDGKIWTNAIRKIKKRKRLAVIAKQAIEVLKGLEALHNHKIIHRDIRPENILITENQAIIIDFEVVKATILQEIDTYSPYTFIYSPPEQVLKAKDLINETSDFFALGITLWHLFTGEFPYYHKIPEVLANLMITYPVKKHKKIPDRIWPVIEKATKKYNFKTPPLKIPLNERIEMLQVAQALRYQSAQKFIKDLKQCCT